MVAVGAVGASVSQVARKNGPADRHRQVRAARLPLNRNADVRQKVTDQNKTRSSEQISSLLLLRFHPIPLRSIPSISRSYSQIPIE